MLKICETCKEEFNARLSKRKYCSRKCANKKAWNAGLDTSDPRIKSYTEKMTSTVRKQYENGRRSWIEGKGHNKEIRNKMSKIVSKQYEDGREPWNKGLTIEQYPDTERSRKNFSDGWYTEKRKASFKGFGSKLELFFEKECLEENFLYTKQKCVEGKLFDFAIGNVLIEVDGDYHHCNPKKYTPDSVLQKQTIINDHIKNSIALRNGFKILRFWETDIYENPEAIRNKIMQEID
jgi:very-short-patch-repair endonuclease